MFILLGMKTFPIIEKLGGRERTFERLRAAGHEIKTVHAIRMWIARGQIAGDAQVQIMAACDKDGISYTSADFELTEVPDSNGEAA